MRMLSVPRFALALATLLIHGESSRLRRSVQPKTASARSMESWDQFFAFSEGPAEPPQFLLISSPSGHKISYILVDHDSTAMSRVVMPLIDVGLDEPRGIAYHPQTSRLYVADPFARTILSYKVEVHRCLNPKQKSGVFGFKGTSDPIADELKAQHSPTACKLPYELTVKDPVDVIHDTFATWVTVDRNGNLFFSDQERQSINVVHRFLLDDLHSGQIQASQVQRQSAHEAEVMLTLAESEAIRNEASEGSGGVRRNAQEAFQKSAVELFRGGVDPSTSMPGALFSDSVGLYWSNQAGGFEHGAVSTGSADFHALSHARDGQKISGILSAAIDSAVGIAGSDNAIYFSDGLQRVYGMPKYGGNITELSGAMVEVRNLIWDGSQTLFIADGGNNTIYAMPCGLQQHGAALPVVAMHDPFGLALIAPTSPAVKLVLDSGASGNMCSVTLPVVVMLLAFISSEV